jgi:transposase
MKKENRRVVFKEYTMGQLQLPMDLETMIPEKHVVRVVSASIEKMDLKPLLERYKGGGTSSYHPKMMLKVLVYAYTQRIYSSRQIAKGLRENVNFMWISGNNRPDFRTINRFRGEVMKGIIEEIFASVMALLIEEGYVKLENYYLDGTKVEANANKYSSVWAKNTRRYKRRVEEQIKELLEEIERVNEAENEKYGDKDLEELGEESTLDSEKLEKKIRELNERLKKNTGDRKLANAVKTLEKDYLPRQKKYEEQERKLAGRNSYARTDKDATFMRMKGDLPQKAQPKAGYNIQVGTENQFIVGFSLHQRAGDTDCMVAHLERLREQAGRLPQRVVADAGYGSEENYVYLEREGVENFVKYKHFCKEQKRTWQKENYRVESWAYDGEHDEFICPQGEKLTYRQTRHEKSKTGYLTERREYECQECSGCPQKSHCTRSEGNRSVGVSLKLIRYRETVRRNLLSEQGKTLRSRRAVEVESVFGHIKHNWGFRRFTLRGLDKVRTEWGLLCIAHNMAKLAVQ